MSPDKLSDPIPISKGSYGKDVFITRQSVASVFVADNDIVWIEIIGGNTWPSKYSLEDTVLILKGEKEL